MLFYVLFLLLSCALQVWCSDLVADLCDRVKEARGNWIVPVDQQYQLLLNLCGFACNKSNLCLTDIHRKPIVEFNQPTVVSYEKFTYFLNFASLENTKSSDGFPFLAQVRLMCEEEESEEETDGDGIVKNTSDRVVLDGVFLDGVGVLKPPGELDVKTPLYQLTWRSSAFCKESPKRHSHELRITVLLLWIGLVSLLLYFVIGTAVNYFGRGKRGAEVLPHYDSFSDVGRKLSEFWENLRQRLREPYGPGDYVRANQREGSIPGGFV